MTGFTDALMEVGSTGRKNWVVGYERDLVAREQSLVRQYEQMMEVAPGSFAIPEPARERLYAQALAMDEATSAADLDALWRQMCAKGLAGR